MGMLDKFKKNAKSNIITFNELAKINIPIIGIEPSVTLFYEDEYKSYFAKSCNYKVDLIQVWLEKIIDEKIKNGQKWHKPLSNYNEYKLFTHCIERAGIPDANKQWKKVFDYFGAKLTYEPLGCCGMAGLYGHLSENKSKSINIYKNNWGKVIKGMDMKNIVVSGFSCRCQIERMENKGVYHPLDMLARMIA